MDNTAFFKLTYGLYLLTAREGEKDNGCIINTAIQAASEPKLISICVINANLTCDMIKATGRFNISVLTQKTDFSLFKNFGMQSGRTSDKFADAACYPKSANGLRYYEKANALFSCRVTAQHDLGSHTLFLAEIEDGVVLEDAPSVTYEFYQSNIKPKNPAPAASSKKKWVCKVCGYIYEGDELPKDYICPICKHGAEVFEEL